LPHPVYHILIIYLLFHVLTNCNTGRGNPFVSFQFLPDKVCGKTKTGSNILQNRSNQCVCQFSAQNVKCQSHRTSKTSRKWLA